MAEYNPRQELMATQKGLLREYEHQLTQDIEKKMAILSCLSQWEQDRERVLWHEVWRDLECENKISAS